MGLTKSFYTLEQIRRDNLSENSEMVTVKVKLLRHTQKAILTQSKIVVSRIVSTKATPWLPKSQVLEPDPIALNLVKTDEELVLIIPLWLAKTNGLTFKEI